MISQTPCKLRFGNNADIEHLHEWQKLDCVNQQMLYDLKKKPSLAAFEVHILIPNKSYIVFYYSTAGQLPRKRIATSIRDVWNTIEEFELEHWVMQS